MGRVAVVSTGYAREALRELGTQIKIARVDRRWTQKHLAAVIHASERTVTLIERGSPTVSVGHVFNAAVAVGVPLFEAHSRDTMMQIRTHSQEIARLIPKRVVKNAKGDNVDFDF